MKVDKGKRIRMKIKLESDGKVIEETAVEYFQGSGTMLLGLEKAVEGMAAGEKKSGTLKPEEAFGDPAKEIKKTISRKEFPEDAVLDKGAEFAAKAENGQNVVLLIDEATDESVEARLRHPMANKAIDYSVEIIKVTDPSPPPLPGALLQDDD